MRTRKLLIMLWIKSISAMHVYSLKKVIAAARQRMLQRNPDQCTNRDLEARELGELGAIEPGAMQLWADLVRQRGLTTRSSLQLLRVSRTIADLNDRAKVDDGAIAEACCFRCDDLLRDDHSAAAPSR